MPGDSQAEHPLKARTTSQFLHEFEALDDGTVAPRMAIGLDGSGQKLIIVVIDGRQPLYSQGATLAKLAEIMLYCGADTAMNSDGGGSLTLVVQGSLGPRVLNSPIDNNITGRERAMGNHLGIFIP